MNNKTVSLYSKVTVKSEERNGSFTLVPSGEINIKENKISSDSPLGKALLNKLINELVSVPTPSGMKKFRIIDISKLT